MAKTFSYEWWHEHYREVRGNLKTTALYAVIGGLVTAFHFLVEGMPWWRHGLVDFLFAFLAIWLGAALWNSQSWRSDSAESQHAPEDVAVIGFGGRHTLEGVEAEHVRLMGIGNRIDGVFTPLQIDALSLLGFLAKFIERIGDRPSPKDGQEYADIRGDAYHWAIKMQASYEADCAPEINRFISKLERQTGRLNTRLRTYKDHVHDVENIQTIRAQLWVEVLRMADVDLTGGYETEYIEGPNALQKFEDGMKKLFQAPKPESRSNLPRPNQSQPARISICACPFAVA